MCILIVELALAADVFRCHVVHVFRDFFFVRCGLCVCFDVASMVLVIRTVLRTRTEIPDLMQTKNILT